MGKAAVTDCDLTGLLYTFCDVAEWIVAWRRRARRVGGRQDVSEREGYAGRHRWGVSARPTYDRLTTDLRLATSTRERGAEWSCGAVDCGCGVRVPRVSCGRVVRAVGSGFDATRN